MIARLKPKISLFFFFEMEGDKRTYNLGLTFPTKKESEGN